MVAGIIGSVIALLLGIYLVAVGVFVLNEAGDPDDYAVLFDMNSYEGVESVVYGGKR